jgi:hypothetical protein
VIDPAPHEGPGTGVPATDLPTDPSTELPSLVLPGVDRAPTQRPEVQVPALEPAGPRPGFAHASEAEMARILDFYDVEWRYEPTTFPILWNLDGDVIESFSPDFFLPDFDLYLEMTTLKQSLVRKKNRKLRRLRELYPDIRIKLFYARDFRAMMLKYGRLGLARSLSGTSGQLVGGELPRSTPDPLAGLDVEAGPEIEKTPTPGSSQAAFAPDLGAPDLGAPDLTRLVHPRTSRATSRGGTRGRTAPAGKRQSETA